MPETRGVSPDGSVDAPLSAPVRRSVFAHIFRREGVSCFFHSLKILPVYFDRTLEAYVSPGPGGDSPRAMVMRAPPSLRPPVRRLIGTLRDTGILVPVNWSEEDYMRKVRDLAFKGPNIRVLVLHLTDFCNLRCRYCFVEGGKPGGYENRHMSQEVAGAALGKFADAVRTSTLPKPPSIVFYGGEPLMNIPVLRHALECLKELQGEGRLPVGTGKILITNGTRITRRIARLLKRHNVLTSVSIDGPEFLHDQNRVYPSGKGSFRDSLRGFRILMEAGMPPTVSSVLSESSLDRVPEILEWLIDELGVRALGFNHVSIVPNVSEYDPAYESRFAGAVVESHEIVLQRGDVYERRMSRKLNSFVEREILKADCTGCGEQMAVSPDGMIGICQGYMGTRDTFAGSVFDSTFDAVSHPVFEEWSRRSPLNMPQCLDCQALALCGGGCPRNAQFISGSIWDVDVAYCPLAKRSVEWMIWKIYDVAQTPAQGEPASCEHT